MAARAGGLGAVWWACAVCMTPQATDAQASDANSAGLAKGSAAVVYERSDSATLDPPVPAKRPQDAPVAVDVDEPWRAEEHMGLPWFRCGLQHRSRFEHLSNDFRAANPDNATGLSMRTLISAEVRVLPFVMGLELQDSRLWASASTPLNTGLVNPLGVLQGYLGLQAKHVLVPRDAASLTVGRMTIDLGSRRLVARNEFRNTINAFTGVDAQWTSPHQDLVRAFAVMPVIRLPSDPEGLADNRLQPDRENTSALLWTAFFRSRRLPARFRVEAYMVGFHEGDHELAPSANRQLLTPAMRVLRPLARGKLDIQLEWMGQFGTSRASTNAADTLDLTHRAFSMHATMGYLFDAPLSPYLALQYDYASGDEAPDDGTNNRFDPLFSARRFEFGPTGLFGAIARSNINTPGVRFELQPHRRVDALLGYRLVWLASARDAWTTAGLRDPTGDSGTFVGQHLEARGRWHILPGNLSVELGAALLVRGEFSSTVTGANDANPVFVYTQFTGTI